MTKQNRITRVNFSWALPEGLWTERENGDCCWEHAGSLLTELGGQELTRITKIAHANGMTGIWKAC